MIQLIGLKSECTLEIREKLSINSKHYEDYIQKLLHICEEVVIISTCNRTEIYFNSEDSNNSNNVNDINENIVEKVFNILGWDKDYIKHTFYVKENDAVEHLMEIACGFHSKILGEDQILGQIKTAYNISLEIKGVAGELQRLFQLAITCGKEFKQKSELYKIPVSASSIAIKECRARGLTNFMILGYGEVGKLVAKYILGGEFKNIYAVVRDVNSICIKDERIKVIPFGERSKYYNKVDCIISCTSAPHCVITRNQLIDKKILIFDLAVPRDVNKDVYDMENVEVYNIDKISRIDDENKNKRKKIMYENRKIINKYIAEFKEWQQLREAIPAIKKIKKCGEAVYIERYKTFKNKKNTKDNEALAKMLLKSTSDAYVNRAIDVIKEEQLKGRAEECLRIIEKIFSPQN